MEARSQRLVYPSDLTDAEWQWIRDVIPQETGGGRHRDTAMRQVVNGILYLLRSGCSWCCWWSSTWRTSKTATAHGSCSPRRKASFLGCSGSGPTVAT